MTDNNRNILTYSDVEKYLLGNVFIDEKTTSQCIASFSLLYLLYSLLHGHFVHAYCFT